MSLNVVTAPTALAVTLDDAKAHSRVLANDEDASLAQYLMAAHDFVETYTRRTLAPTTYDLVLDYGWPSRIELPRPPLQSVVSVKYIDSSGVEQTLAADQYLVLGAGSVHDTGSIVPAYGVTWPSVQNRPAAITVRFIAGYGGTPPLPALPRALHQCILLMTDQFHANRTPVVTGTIASSVPLTVTDAMFPYRCLP